MNEIETFVRLKYELPSEDLSPSHINNHTVVASYPKEVKQKWAWRMAEEAECFHCGNPKIVECIKIAKLYRDGKATMKKLDKAWDDAQRTYGDTAAYAYYLAAQHNITYYYASMTAEAALNAHGHNTTDRWGVYPEWKMYIGWLIEELCEYEQLKENENE